MPKVYLIDDQTPMHLLPEEVLIMQHCGSTGIINTLREELSGVLGHELAHVKHRDILRNNMQLL